MYDHTQYFFIFVMMRAVYLNRLKLNTKDLHLKIKKHTYTHKRHQTPMYKYYYIIGMYSKSYPSKLQRHRSLMLWANFQAPLWRQCAARANPGGAAEKLRLAKIEKEQAAEGWTYHFFFGAYCWWLKSGYHQLRLVVYPIDYKVLAPSQVVVRDFWTINSITSSFFSPFGGWVN